MTPQATSESTPSTMRLPMPCARCTLERVPHHAQLLQVDVAALAPAGALHLPEAEAAHRLIHQERLNGNI
eukprot:5312099-Alexandrium_andersonii.AAC.1